VRFRIVFFGTPEFAVPSLRALIDGPDEVAGVICQADRPAGRGHKLRMPPVKVLAQECGVPVEQPTKIRNRAFEDLLRSWNPDLIVVAAYGRILPNNVLELPEHGCINVHASLLPKYRGAAPIQWAIARGERETGVTIMQMNEAMDEGDVLLQRATPIGASETAAQLSERLAVLGAEALMETIAALARGELEPVPQDHGAMTLAPIITKADGEIDWRRSADEIAYRCRGFSPWPSIFTHLGDKLLKIHCARAIPDTNHLAPGTVLEVGDRIEVATGEGTLAIEELQLEGRKRLTAREFGRSRALQRGMRLGKQPSG
jgi:methionyl-tRNA formyltransferase